MAACKIWIRYSQERARKILGNFTKLYGRSIGNRKATGMHPGDPLVGLRRNGDLVPGVGEVLGELTSSPASFPRRYEARRDGVMCIANLCDMST